MNKRIYRQITKKGSKTFYWSTLFFPKNVRNDVFILYSYLRTVDDLIDSQPQQITQYYKYKELTLNSWQGKASNNPIIDGYVQVARSYEFNQKWLEDFFRDRKWIFNATSIRHSIN